MVCYFFNFLDRVNVSFAALDMNKDLGFSASVFGFGSGILFLSYMLCETPSNAFLAHVGARKWLARIMVSWGIIASCMMFVTGEYSFYTMRVFLGAAEAEFRAARGCLPSSSRTFRPRGASSRSRRRS